MGGRIAGIIFFVFWLGISGTVSYLFSTGIHKEVQNGASPWMYAILLFPISFVLIGIWGMVMSLRGGGDGGGISSRFQQTAKTELGKGTSLGGVLFGLPFFLAGMGIMIFMCIVPVVKSVLAMSWERIPATVTESQMKTNYDSDGNTYKAVIKFRYRYQGQEYESDSYDFISFVSTSDRKGVQRKLDAAPVGSEQSAYVNPGRPDEAVLSVRLSWFYLFTFIFGAIFAAVGGGIIFAMLTGFRPGKVSKRAVPQPRDLTSGPVLLKSRSGGPMLRFVGILIFTAIWCGVVYLLFQKDAPGLFKGIFGFFGLLMILATGHAFLALFNPRVRLETESKYVPVGGTLAVNWLLTGNGNKIKEFTVSLVGQEEATYRRGTSTYTDRETFYEHNLVDHASGAVGGGNVTLKVPDGTMYTWKASNNKIVWLIKVNGVIEKWPDIKEEYEIEVIPAV
ncbi:MAG: DUF3592 domain-containing protein [Candidatus Omnitrophica bacterium]|nr:DUF3592 domain-containing protein [Candidatus Omnitrophota bacterium]